MLDVLRRNSDMYPLISNNALVMSLGPLGKSMSTVHSNRRTNNQPIVEAATLLGVDSSTEIIDVNKLCQKPAPRVQYVRIADASGQLYCVDGHTSASCWLKVVTIAKDCQSYNVLLMSTERGVVLKVMKNITPGEPLVMWFTENVLAMLNMPYLTNLNITGDNQYICHLCNNHFEDPNPLKIHLALDCSRLDSNFLWAQLAKEFNSIPRSFPMPFNFEMKMTPPAPYHHSPPIRSPPIRSPPIRSPPILINVNTNKKIKLNDSLSFSSNSSTSSNQTSPVSSNQASPTSPGLLSYCSSTSSTTKLSPVKKIVDVQHSAFKPYITKAGAYSPTILPTIEKPPSYHIQPPIATVPIATDPMTQAAQMETIVSNLGKSKQGHQCLYCGKMYSRKYGLKIHIRTHTGYKPLKCKYCLRPFGDPSNLNKHVRLHSEGGENPYRCELCGKVLVRRRDLERHIRSRHQDNAGHISDVSSDGMDV